MKKEWIKYISINSIGYTYTIEWRNFQKHFSKRRTIVRKVLGLLSSPDYFKLTVVLFVCKLTVSNTLKNAPPRIFRIRTKKTQTCPRCLQYLLLR